MLFRLMSFDVEMKLNLVRDMLIGVAKFDGQITEEEARLIDAICVPINDYFETFARLSSQPGGASSLDRAELFRKRLSIISKSVKTIREDLKVTADEKELFNAIQRLLPELPTA